MTAREPPALSPFGTGGVALAARSALRRAARTGPGRLAVMARDLMFGWRRADLFELERPARPVPPSAAFPPGYVFRRAGRDDAAACSRVTKVPEAEILRRLDAGDACWVVARGAVATVQWVHDGPFYVRGLGYAHDGTAGERYIYGVVTDPAERGKGLFRTAGVHLRARLFSEGATRLVAIVEVGNTPSLVTLTKAGYRRTRRIESLVLLGVSRTVVTPVERGRPHRTWRLLPPGDRFVI